MRVLLKQSVTGHFLRAADCWTADSAEALDFKTTPSAMDYARIHGYKGLSIILKSSDARQDLEMQNCC